jgi:hypothetical protein
LLLHEVGEDAGIGGETGEGKTIVGVDWYDLLLIRGELFRITLLRKYVRWTAIDVVAFV